MKKMNYILVLVLLIILVAASKKYRKDAREDSRIELSMRSTGEVAVDSVDFIGVWRSNKPANKNISNKESVIQSIEFINDTLVSIQLIDSTGIKTISGQWEAGFHKDINRWIKLELESDVKVTYWTDKSHKFCLLLNLIERNDKVAMTSGNVELVKD